MARPMIGAYASFYHNYIQKVFGENPKELINSYSAEINDFILNIPETKADYAYAEGKWTVKDVIQHIIDAERIFSYRALRFARKDETHLPGFDENIYAANANVHTRTFQSLKEECIALRKSTDLLIASFTEEQLQQKGISNNKEITVNSICFIIFGHILHHKQILEERYLCK